MKFKEKVDTALYLEMRDELDVENEKILLKRNVSVPFVW